MRSMPCIDVAAAQPTTQSNQWLAGLWPGSFHSSTVRPRPMYTSRAARASILAEACTGDARDRNAEALQEPAVPQDEYEHLIGPIEGRMIHSMWRILGDPDDADEALQDALAAVWQRLARVRSHPNPHALVLRMCANAAYDKLRRRRRRREVSLAPDDPEDPSLSAQERLARSERQAQVREAISQLSRKQAVAVLMRDAQDQSYESIAHALGCRQATSRKHVARARARLRGLLAHILSGEAKGGR